MDASSKEESASGKATESFWKIEDNIKEVEEEEQEKVPRITPVVGDKRPYTVLGDDDENISEQDLETDMAVSSAQMACNFWNKIFSEKNILDDVKPVKKMPATISGKSRSNWKDFSSWLQSSKHLLQILNVSHSKSWCHPLPQSQNEEASDIANAGETIVGSSGCPILMSVPQNDPSDKFQATPMPDLTPEETVLQSEAQVWVSPLNDEEDEAEEQPIYLRITPFKLLHHVNKIIIPSLGFDIGAEKISISCARHWLIKLGYAMKEVKKGMYVDGHERADMIEYRKKFLKEVEKNAQDEDLEPIEPSLPPGEKLHIPVYHDEKKREGHAIHISDFIIEQTGCITLNEEQLQFNNQLLPGQKLEFTDAQEIMYPSKNSDGWCNMEKLIVQVKWMISIFERMHPGAVGEFFFDQSSAHGAYAPDALNAKEMNLRPGDKQRSMHFNIYSYGQSQSNLPWNATGHEFPNGSLIR
ncbi:hypothetical protein M422DRAFT_274056 [Sphaerobolus stellatus SS14]|uniref:Uncharacterized protein n=1 Tax=Sphaerobolus stellatus (strain SS14) TaxID=990650 RepID=A0A0C9U7I8_SPHS4|nr:hypothetical protein M422DRAFT_274056 [Sphaerobolus stellatus SS14]